MLLFVSLVFTSVAVTAEATLEYRVKAACLYNFAKFVEWPTNAFASATAPLVFGILGDDPFEGDLAKVVAGRTVKGRPLQVVRFANVAELERGPACHVLFLGAAVKGQWTDVRAQLQGGSVLTVAEDAEFLNDGGVIRFLNEDNKIRFSVNLDAARAANLAIRSELLNLAREVRGGNPKD
jgi:hypothetical protein